jgi:hypothetical protein
LLADRSLSRLLKEDWPRSLEELEERKAQRGAPAPAAPAALTPAPAPAPAAPAPAPAAPAPRSRSRAKAAPPTSPPTIRAAAVGARGSRKAGEKPPRS